MEARSDVHGAIGEREPLIIRRVDAIPLGLPLSKPVAMAGATVRQALNILVRIESADGKSSRYCVGPAKSQAELDTKIADWEFVDCKTGAGAFGGQTTACISINHATGHCEPNAGESYVAQYLGIVPSPTADNPLGGCAVVSDCQKSLGGALTDWTCTPVGSSGRGTCTCGG